MKKDTTRKRKSEQQGNQKEAKAKRATTIGIDLGDRSSQYCGVDKSGEVVERGSAATTKKGLAQAFGSRRRCRIAMEVGTHSPWVSRLLRSWGHEVIVANARRVRLITESSQKNDKLDARTLAQLAQAAPQLLSPVRHRSEEAQADLLMIRARAGVVEARTKLVNAARGLVKSMGERLRSCDAACLGPEELAELPAGVRAALEPLLVQVQALSETIRHYDERIEQIAKTRYPETERLRQIQGVGPLIALTYVLTVDDPCRFRKSRDVGAYLGLRPRRRQSGNQDPQLRITKEGDRYLRKLLVQGAHYILGHRGPDTDLKRWGQKLAGRGNKNAKKRALVAVARKLAVLLHKLWVSGEVYEPLRQSVRKQLAAA
jgi:transposase